MILHKKFLNYKYLKGLVIYVFQIIKHFYPLKLFMFEFIINNKIFNFT